MLCSGLQCKDTLSLENEVTIVRRGVECDEGAPFVSERMRRAPR